MSFDLHRYEAILPEIVSDFVCAELKARTPQKYLDLTAQRVLESADWRRDFSLDSLDRMSLASACAEYFNIYDSGREDSLLGQANCQRWSEVIVTAQQEQTRNITFRSSGSTSDAKHFRHRADWLEAEAQHWAEAIQARSRKRIVAQVPLHHIYGYLWIALLACQSGLEFVRFPTETLRAPKFEEGDLLITTPHLLEALLARGGRLNAPDLIAVSSTGQFSSHSPTSACDALGIGEIWEIYGSSETGGLGVRRTPSPQYTWLPYLQTSVDSDGNVVAISRALAGVEVALPIPDRLSAKGENQFQVGTRADNVLKIRGHRIDLDELQKKLRSAPLISDANVRPLGDGANVAIKAFLVGKDSLLPPAELISQTRQWLAQRFPHSGYIEDWRVGDEVPRSPMGKLVDWK